MENYKFLYGLKDDLNFFVFFPNVIRFSVPSSYFLIVVSVYVLAILKEFHSPTRYALAYK